MREIVMDSDAAECRRADRRRTVRRIVTRGLLVFGASLGITAAAWALSSASASAEEAPAPPPLQVPGIEQLTDAVSQFLPAQQTSPVDEITKFGGAIRDGIAEHLPPGAAPSLPILPGSSVTPSTPKPGSDQLAPVYAPRRLPAPKLTPSTVHTRQNGTPPRAAEPMTGFGMRSPPALGGERDMPQSPAQPSAVPTVPAETGSGNGHTFSPQQLGNVSTVDTLPEPAAAVTAPVDVDQLPVMVGAQPGVTPD